MIVNLFSSFDPSSCVGSFNWISLIIFFAFIPSLYSLAKNNLQVILGFVSKRFLIETNIILKYSKAFSVFLLSLFFLTIFRNFFGLFPYVFTATRHIRIRLRFSLVLWVSLILFGYLMKSKEIFAHLVPVGTPVILISFIVLIESIRTVIRPLTLAIRLSANIIAGHLLLTLLGNQLANLSIMGFILPTELLLLGLEITVSIIQGYVFVILLRLYIRDVRESH